MTRQFATTATSVWDDEDWWELDGEQQRVFIMLYTQKDITAAGTLPLTLGRWANSTKGCTIEGLSQALRELSDAHYVVVDWRRELLLVRSFIRWDKGYTNTKRLKAIQTTAKAVGSKMLAGVLAFEMDRLNIPHEITEKPIDVKAMAHRSPIDTPSSPVSEMRKGPDECPIDALSIDAGSGYVSSYLPGTPTGTGTGTGNREPEHADVPSAAANAAPRRGARIPDQFFITEKMRTWAADEVPGLDLTWYTKQFVDHWRSATRNATKLDWVRAWQKWMRDEFVKPNHRRINGHSPPQRSTAEVRAEHAWDLANQIRAEEAAAETIHLPQIGSSR